MSAVWSVIASLGSTLSRPQGIPQQLSHTPLDGTGEGGSTYWSSLDSKYVSRHCMHFRTMKRRPHDGRPACLRCRQSEPTNGDMSMEPDHAIESAECAANSHTCLLYDSECTLEDAPRWTLLALWDFMDGMALNTQSYGLINYYRVALPKESGRAPSSGTLSRPMDC